MGEQQDPGLSRRDECGGSEMLAGVRWQVRAGKRGQRAAGGSGWIRQGPRRVEELASPSSDRAGGR